MVEQRHLAAGAVVVLDRHGRFRGHGNGPSFGGTACVSGVAADPASLSLSPSAPPGGGAVAGVIGGLSSDSMPGTSQSEERRVGDAGVRTRRSRRRWHHEKK